MPKIKLSQNDRERIITMLHEGYTATQIAKQYGLHEVYVRIAFKDHMRVARKRDRERGLKNCCYPNVKKWISEHTEIDLETLAQYCGVHDRTMLKYILSKPEIPIHVVMRLSRIMKLTREEVTFYVEPGPLIVDGYIIERKDER